MFQMISMVAAESNQSADFEGTDVTPESAQIGSWEGANGALLRDPLAYHNNSCRRGRQTISYKNRVVSW